MDTADFERAGLYDPEAPDAPARLVLLVVLAERGATIEEIRAADDDGRLPGFAFEAALRTGPMERTTREAAERIGVEPEALRRLRLASGFADTGLDAPAWTDTEIETLKVMVLAQQIYGEETGLQLARVVGSSLARIAEALATSFRANVAVSSLAHDPSGHELAQLNLFAADSIPAFIDALGVMLRRHLINAIRPMDIPDRVGQALAVQPPEGYETIHEAIGFADLVGFTALSQDLEFADLAVITTNFEGLASDLVLEHGGRVVKLIGDEIMFVAPDVEAACDIAVGIVEASGRDGVPPVRAAVAFGELLARDGDYFGPVVNLASRIVGAAEPGAVVVPAAIGEIPGFILTPIGSRNLKGFDEEVALAAVSRRGTRP